MTSRPHASLFCFLALTHIACGTANVEEASSGAPNDGSSTAGTRSGGGAGGSLGGSSSSGSGGTITTDPGTGGSVAGTAGGGGTAPTGGSGGTAGASGASGGGISPGTLTAGAWDDNRNYDFFSEYRSVMRTLDPAGLLPLTDAEHDAANEASSQLSSHETLDVALVIDTTGSMGDEMRYLTAEFLALSSSINEAYPNAEQRWALVAYRDEGDLYVVRSADFTDDLEAFQATLAQQGADGGGDTPEAPDQGLAATAGLAWRSGGATARLAFWIADAPHHAENARSMANAIRAVRDAGVHLYPVASSGVDELTEHSMRSAAQLTGGRYLFLTDDSGVGNSHKEPTIPCYFVTRLDDAILRMVDIELSGAYHEPTITQIIRTGGNPRDGSCTLTSGEIVFAY